MSDDDQDEPIHRVDTVPPPDGESDAYNAPTRVGPMAAAVVEEMMHAAERKATQLAQRADEKKAALDAEPKSGGKPASGVTSQPPISASAKASTGSSPASTKPVSQSPSSVPKPVSAKPPRIQGGGYALSGEAAEAALIQDVAPMPKGSQGPPPRMYEDDDEGENAATVLSQSAKAPVVAPLPPRPPVRPPPQKPLAVPARPAVPSPGAAAPVAPAQPLKPTQATQPIIEPPPPMPMPAAPAQPVTFAPPAPPAPLAPLASVPPMSSAPPAPLPFGVVPERTSVNAPMASPMAATPGTRFDQSRLAMWMPLAVGLSIFIVGLVLYVWMR